MANEATLNLSLYINQPTGLGQWRSSIPSFRANVVGTIGPTPGGIIATVAGVDINFGSLTIPALCVIQNYDPTNFVEWGMWDPVYSEFMPLGEVLPLEGYIIRLSRRFGFVEGVGTGTTGSGRTLRVKANTAPCDIFVGAFQK